MRPDEAHRREAITALVRSRQPDVVDYRGWQAIDAEERKRGREGGRVRNKLTDTQAMIEVAQQVSERLS